MNPLLRWGKFNLVGAMGMGLQLAALALFNRWMAGHYLYASAAAIELTLLHNFIWHLHYTWSDRRDGATRLRQLVRFHLSNGLVSMLGNLILMRLLVHEARLPLLVSNVIAILCCSVANFCLGNNWAFAEACKADQAICPASSPGYSPSTSDRFRLPKGPEHQAAGSDPPAARKLLVPHRPALER
jgi:putative flippase GtrA